MTMTNEIPPSIEPVGSVSATTTLGLPPSTLSPSTSDGGGSINGGMVALTDISDSHPTNMNNNWNSSPNHPLLPPSTITDWNPSEHEENHFETRYNIKEDSSEMCSACGDIINDRYILQVAGRSWHSHCLRCSVCNTGLDSHSSCFIRDEILYCKLDYAKMFGAKCYKCCHMISPTDWVRKAKDQIYHLACFSCDGCKRQLSTGEEFGIFDGRVLCKSHFLELRDGVCSSSDESGESSENNNNKNKKSKRMRTTFTEEQIQILQANFQIDSNPDGQDLERIAQITGLSKRVTQVWFQNCRARQKKYINNGSKRNNHGLSPANTSADDIAVSKLTPQLDLHVTYSTFRTQPPPPSSDSNPEASQDSISLMRGEV